MKPCISLSRTLSFFLVATLAANADVAVMTQGSSDGGASSHLVSFLSGDVVAAPQTLSGTVVGGKADLSGTLKATYNFDKWIANTNQGDSSVYKVLRKAQVDAGGFLVGKVRIRVDVSAVVNSFIEVTVGVGKDSYTIKLYTCVDHRKTTVTETATDLLISQTEGTACAYKVPEAAWSNEGEDVVYTIRK
ncbi:MAG: hypothetical protein JST11_13745 [Acidobacteria bacterium]|nr:hypothetical protein [Acidobacteriota bacterium]